MSYDLFVWQGPPLASSEDVWTLIEEVCENENLDVLEGDAKVPSFLEDLFAEFPSLEDAAVDLDGTPWSSTGNTSDKHAMLSLAMGEPSTLRVMELIVGLCQRHRLHCFDPQSEDFLSRG